MVGVNIGPNDLVEVVICRVHLILVIGDLVVTEVMTELVLPPFEVSVPMKDGELNLLGGHLHIVDGGLYESGKNRLVWLRGRYGVHIRTGRGTVVCRNV